MRLVRLVRTFFQTPRVREGVREGRYGLHRLRKDSVLYQGTTLVGPHRLLRALEAAEKLGFVSGHGFSRATLA